MTSSDCWTSRYVTSTDPAEVRQAVKLAHLTSGQEIFELVYFSAVRNAPNILISQGSGGHAYVFAELAYHLHLTGYNVSSCRSTAAEQLINFSPVTATPWPSSRASSTTALACTARVSAGRWSSTWPLRTPRSAASRAKTRPPS